MALRGYTSPGVSISETLTPAIAPLIASPSTIAIVGAAAGTQSATERILLQGTTPVLLKYTGVNIGSVTAVDSATGATVAAGNYNVTLSSDPDSTITGDEIYQVFRLPPPTTSPTLATGTGTLTGIYVYAVSYVNGRGETTIGPASSPITLTAQGASLTNIPVDATAGNTTTARNIYRAKVTGGVTGTFNLVATIANNSGTTLSNESLADATAALAATPNVGIADGGVLVVTYTYTDSSYYAPTHFSDYDDIADKYGQPFDANGIITSPLSFAASLAFQNGASEIITLAALSGSDTDLSNALTKLEPEDARIITVASGSTVVHAALVAHVASMNSQGKFRQAILGRDGSTTAIAASVLQAAAQAYNNEAVILVSPASFNIQNPVDASRTARIGGQYMAAAVAGMFAARDVQVPLTRKTVAGFADISNPRTPTVQAQDSQAGLLEIINTGGVLQIRHGVTTAVNNVNTAEASVIRAKYEMAHRLQQVLDGSIVGQIIGVSDVPLTVANVVTGVLEQLTVEGAISAYANVKARLLASNLTTCEVRFAYLPAFPINNVVVRFTIDTNTGDFSGLSDVTAA